DTRRRQQRQRVDRRVHRAKRNVRRAGQFSFRSIGGKRRVGGNRRECGRSLSRISSLKIRAYRLKAACRQKEDQREANPTMPLHYASLHLSHSSRDGRTVSTGIIAEERIFDYPRGNLFGDGYY